MGYIFRKVKEGDCLDFGLNVYEKTLRTSWAFVLMIPLSPSLTFFGRKFDTGDFYKGFQIYCLAIRMRRRTDFQVEKGNSRYSRSISIQLKPLWAKAFMSEEFYEDLGCPKAMPYQLYRIANNINRMTVMGNYHE